MEECDVVTFELAGEKMSLIKRVVALPGETMEVRGGQVLINDQLLEEPWTTRPGGPDYPPTVVPPLHVFVLGDNRGIPVMEFVVTTLVVFAA